MPKFTKIGDKIHAKFTKQEVFDSGSIIVPDETPIIRYMDIVKFMSIISNQSIWFVRPDQFSDEYEGFSTVDDTLEAKETADVFRKMSVVSCWNHFTTESFALWRIYLVGSKYGVAIVSTVVDFMSSINNKSEKEYITPFGIKYVTHDYKVDGINSEIAITRKKSFYNYEEEVRFALIYGGTEQPLGRAISVVPSTLIKEVICSPYMPGWVKDLLTQTLKSNNLSHIPIRDSIVKDSILK